MKVTPATHQKSTMVRRMVKLAEMWYKINPFANCES